MKITYSAKESKEIGDTLKKNLGPEWLSYRNGPSGRLTYIEGKTAINIANDIFGFNGWSSDLKETVVDFVDKNENGKYNIGISVVMRITLKDGTYHEDVGYGAAENARTKAAAFEKARKQAVTDATKRTLRNFGNALGNCLYDKLYVGNIGKMGSPQIKFLPQNLYRHAQFDTKKQEIKQEPEQPKQENDRSRHEQQVKLQTEMQKNSQNQQAQVQLPPPPPQPSNINVSPVKAEKNIESNDRMPPPLMPEDSFSYEGDDEFFVQMLANEDIGVEGGSIFEE